MTSLATNTQIEIPDDFYCPITGNLMNNPVVDPDGHSYERESLLQWLSVKQISPLTRRPLNVDDLTPNRALKRSIDQIRDKIAETQMSNLSRKINLDKLSIPKYSPEINSYVSGDKIHINIKNNSTGGENNLNLGFVIDNSGSMDSEAVIQDENKKKVSHGLSILNVTVAAAKAVVNSLKQGDTACLVSYSSNATVKVETCEITPENQKNLCDEMNKLYPDSTTNMWDGIFKGLEQLRLNCINPLAINALMVLTDGVPNVDPPMGHEVALKRYFDKYPNFKCIVNFYGFGYNLKSRLLRDLAEIGSGDGYSFIPDSTLTGNIFGHGVANLRTTMVTNLKLGVELMDGYLFTSANPCLGHTEFIKTTWGGEITINSTKKQQDKNYIFTFESYNPENTHIANIILKYTFNGKEETIVHKLECNRARCEDKDKFMRLQIIRLEFVELIECLMTNMRIGKVDENRKLITLFIDELRHDKYSNEEYIQNIIYDLEGQIVEALNFTDRGMQENWYEKWGQHYLLSLNSAYKNEIRNNWKDKGVRNFGGSQFDKEVERFNLIFESLPAPKPTKLSSRTKNSNYNYSSVTNMSSYNNQNSGCCARGSRVKMSDGSLKRVENLKYGDKVVTTRIVDDNILYDVSNIKCVIKTVPGGGQMDMCKVGNLIITPYHPIYHKGKWRFPKSMCEPIMTPVKEVYTFIIESRDNIIVEDTIFSTFGHKQTGEVIGHDFFGTERVVNDLKAIDGWGKGIITLTSDRFRRGSSGRVVAII